MQLEFACIILFAIAGLILGAVALGTLTPLHSIQKKLESQLHALRQELRQREPAMKLQQNEPSPREELRSLWGLAEVGPTGVVGPPGPTGPTGATGVPGQTGATGIVDTTLPFWISNTTLATGSPQATGAVVVDGGVYIGKNLIVNEGEAKFLGDVDSAWLRVPIFIHDCYFEMSSATPQVFAVSTGAAASYVAFETPVIVGHNIEPETSTRFVVRQKGFLAVSWDIEVTAPLATGMAQTWVECDDGLGNITWNSGVSQFALGGGTSISGCAVVCLTKGPESQYNRFSICFQTTAQAMTKTSNSLRNRIQAAMVTNAVEV